MPNLQQTLMIVLVGGAFSGAFIGVMSKRMLEWRWRLYGCAVGAIFALADVTLMQESLMHRPASPMTGSAASDIPPGALWSWVPVFVMAFLGARRLIPPAQRKLVAGKAEDMEEAQQDAP